MMSVAINQDREKAGIVENLTGQGGQIWQR
jgi:hypothetical protein